MVLEYSVHVINNKRQSTYTFSSSKKGQDKIERNYMERDFVQLKWIRYTQNTCKWVIQWTLKPLSYIYNIVKYNDNCIDSGLNIRTRKMESF